MRYNKTSSCLELNLAAKFETGKIMLKSSLTTSLIAGILSLPSFDKVAATTSTKEVEKTAGNRSSLAVSKINLHAKNKSNTATFIPNFNSVDSLRTLITNLSLFLSAKNEYSTNASILNPNAIGSTFIEPKTALDRGFNPILANQIAVSPESSTTTLAAKTIRIHVVSPGDTISKIARRYGVSKDDLVRLNQLNNSNVIFINQRLEIPTTKTVLASTERLPNTPQQFTSQVTSSVPDTVANKERREAVSSSKLNSDRHNVAGEDPYLTKFKAQIEQLQNQKQQSPQANRNFSASINSRSAGDRDRLTIEDAPPKIETVSVATSVPASNSKPSLLPENSIALQLPPLPPDEYLPSAFDGYIWPTQGILTSGYGWRWGRMHRGIDIAAPIGTSIVAAASGEVINAGWHSGTATRLNSSIWTVA